MKISQLQLLRESFDFLVFALSPFLSPRKVLTEEAAAQADGAGGRLYTTFSKDPID